MGNATVVEYVGAGTAILGGVVLALAMLRSLQEQPVERVSLDQLVQNQLNTK